LNTHSLEVLEFPAVAKACGSLCLTQKMRLWLEQELQVGGQAFFNDPATLGSHLDAVAFLVAVMDIAPDTPSLTIENLDEFFEATDRTGFVAEAAQLGELMRWLQASEAYLRYLRSGIESVTNHPGHSVLSEALFGLPSNQSLLREMSSYLDSEGNLKEDQIPELKKARQLIFQAQSDLRLCASSYVKEHESMLSGDFSTIRDGRTVLPLRSNYKGRIEGLIHNASASGETLFVEPYEMVALNNACSQAEFAYRQQILVILKRLTASVQAALPQLLHQQAGLEHIDILFGKARYARQLSGNFLYPKDQINLLQVRHPHLGKKAVPVTIAIPEGKHFLVISGPNTGGKTVSLKTLGLCALMLKAGMAIPAAEGSSIPLYDHVFADIGDEQSIASDLSTFSGHITRMSEFLNSADKHSLVLLDELGSGTDPSEGGALAIAIAESFLERGSMLVATSHYAELKALAYTHPGAVNASMEFSETAGRPTYRIIPGIPGRSRALETAERVGLPSAILERARQLCSKQGDVTVDLVQKLTESQRIIQEELACAMEKNRSLEALQARLLMREKELADEKRRLQSDQITETARFLANSRSTVESLIRKLQEFSAQSSQVPSQAVIADIAKHAREDMQELGREFTVHEADFTKNAPRSLPAEELAPGILVSLLDTHSDGRIIRSLKKGIYEVEVHGKRLKIAWDRLSPLANQKPADKPKSSWSVEQRPAASFILDVRGMRLAEARELLVRHIDTCLVQGVTFFSVIHGLGEGILQKGLHDYLSAAPEVASVSFARPEEGGFGKTHVLLRS